MTQYITETKVEKGTINLSDIPIKNNTDVKVIIIQKVELDKLLSDKAIYLSKDIKGNLSDEIIRDRN